MNKTNITSPDIGKRLEDIKAEGRYRFLRSISGAQDAEVMLDGKSVVCMCSNNYLGLANHPAIKEAAANAARQFGVGSGASRLISGNMDIHERLEKRLAEFKGLERALLFNSGYHANVGVLSAIAGKGDYIYSDELNHASIIDGARLSRAKVRIYPHRDMQFLENMLAHDPPEARKLIVTDSLFSMDGDLAPLEALVELKHRHGAMLMIDDAHATGTIGPGGKGPAAEMGLVDKIDITMGTLGKALGCFGAFVGGSKELVELLINTARSFIFTTALPPPVVASAIAALDVIESEPERIDLLRENARYFRYGLKDAGFDVKESGIPIIPLILGAEDTAMEWCARLLEMGIFAQAIRPPTVPEGTSRLRITVMATHTKEHLDKAIEAFKTIRSETE